MTLNEIYAKIQIVEEEISNLEDRLNYLQTTTPETYKQVFTSDWEWKKTGGAVRNTSSERRDLEWKLHNKREELQQLERQYRQRERENYDAPSLEKEQEELDKKRRNRQENERTVAFYASQRRYKEKSVFERATRFISGKRPKWEQLKNDPSITTEDFKTDSFLKR